MKGTRHGARLNKNSSHVHPSPVRTVRQSPACLLAGLSCGLSCRLSAARTGRSRRWPTWATGLLDRPGSHVAPAVSSCNVGGSIVSRLLEALASVRKCICVRKAIDCITGSCRFVPDRAAFLATVAALSSYMPPL
jgi:hypothetical protein